MYRHLLFVLIFASKIVFIGIYYAENFRLSLLLSAMHTYLRIFLLCFLGASWSMFTNSYAQTYALDLDGPEQKICVLDDEPYIERQLQTNKSATLEAVRTQTLHRLQQYAALPNYSDKRSYAYIEIGNLFSSQIKHAVVAYLSNAHLKNKADYYLNLYVYEVQPSALVQVFKAENLSSYYQNVGVSIADFNQNGIPDMLITTSEPEWYHSSKPSSIYYHLLEYTPAPGKPLFTPVTTITNIPNPKFLNRNSFYTLTDCGTGGYCWVSKLYVLQTNGIPLFVAEAGQFGTNIVQVFKVNGNNKIFFTDLPHIDAGNSQLIEQMWVKMLGSFTGAQ